MTQIVKLNVGGIPYVTSLSTMTQYRDSMLGAMVEQQHEQNLIREGKELFIDRDGQIFKYVLAFLRNADKMILPKDVSTLEELHLESEFYLLGGLTALISKKLEEMKTKWQVGDTITTRDLTIWRPSMKQGPISIRNFRTCGHLISSLVGTIVEINAKYVVAKFTGSFLPKESSELEKYRDLSALCVLKQDELMGKPMPSD